MRSFTFAGGSLPLGKKTYLMGILNATPDSFFDGGRYLSPENAAARAGEMEAAGADLIDLGACSTRPGGDVVSEEEELERIKAVFGGVRKAISVPLSVDTFRPAVAAYVLQHGANVINDVSGAVSPQMAALIKQYDAGWVLMHAGPENAKTADKADYPGGVTMHVQAFFDKAIKLAASFGVSAAQICLDPGFGFAKTAEQNLELLQNLHTLDTHGCALLAALSRKRFVGAISGEAAPEDRLFGTLAADVAAVSMGADIVRVHDVKEHLPAMRAADAIYRKGKSIGEGSNY